jgi:hypothetical protein
MGSMGPGGMNMAPQYQNMMRSWDSMQGGGGGGWSGGTSQYNAPPARGYPQPGGQMGGFQSGGQAGQLGARTLGGADEMSQLLSGPGNYPLSQQTQQVGGGFQGGGWGTPQPQMQTMPQARLGQFGGMMPAGQGGQRQDWMRPGSQSFGGMLGGFAPGAVPQRMRQQSPMQMQGGQAFI